MAFTFSSTSGISGITDITISATERMETTNYSENYTISNDHKSLGMSVVQKAYVPSEKYITISPSAITWAASGGTDSVTINSNDDWVVVSDEWIELSRMYSVRGVGSMNTVSGNGNTIIGIRCMENTGSSRTGGITAYCQSDSSITDTTAVSQEGSYVKPYITLGTYSMEIEGSGSTTAVTVQSNTTWSAITDSRWVTINTLSGSGNGNVSFVVDENISNIERRGTITVFNGELTAVLVISQQVSSSKPYIILSPTSFSVPSTGSTGNVISVSANCDYDITTDVAWIALDASSGSGFGSVSFSTLQNRNAMDIGNITFSNSAVSRNVTVQRNEEAKYLSANTTSINVGLSGNTEEVEIYSNVDWEVAVENNWLSVSPLRGNGNGTLRVEIQSASENRYATIFIYNSNYGLSAEINVRQINGRVIYYTSTNNSTITPTNLSNIVSNTYQNGIGTITLSEDLIELPVSAFSQQNRLLTITLPESVEKLSDFAFYNCENLESANIPNSVTGIGRTFNITNISAITIPHSVVELGGMGFAGSPLREIVLPSSLVETGSYNFAGDPLVSVTIEEGITSLGAGNFNGCDKLTSINLPNSLSLLHERCFYNCTGLTEITIGKGMTEMRDSAFGYCSSLAVIYSYAENEPVLNGVDYSPYYYPTFYETPSNVVVHIPRGSSYPSWRSDTWAGRWAYIADL